MFQRDRSFDITFGCLVDINRLIPNICTLKGQILACTELADYKFSVHLSRQPNGFVNGFVVIRNRQTELNEQCRMFYRLMI